MLESIHDLLVSVFDKVSKLKLSYLQLNTRRVICKMPFLRKAKIVQKRKEKVIYALKATSRRQSGLFVYQITLKAFRMPQELTLSDVFIRSILKILSHGGLRRSSNPARQILLTSALQRCLYKLKMP